MNTPIEDTDHPINCSVSATPRLIRSEGGAELIGTIELTFESDQHFRTSVDIQVHVNANITSRLIEYNQTEAHLDVIEEGIIIISIRGVLSSVNSVLFADVPIRLGSVCQIRGVRVNANMLGVSS